MRAWTTLSAVGIPSRHVSVAVASSIGAFASTKSHLIPNGVERRLQPVFPCLQHIAGLRTRTRPQARPRPPYAIYALPKKPSPRRVYPPKLWRAFKAVKGHGNRTGLLDEREWMDVATSRSSTNELEEELIWLAHNNPSSKEIQNIFDELVKKRGVKPLSAHYEALILSNCDPEHGSARNVEAVLAEMEQAGTAIGAGVYSAVLTVLAVHPRASLRRYVVDEMEKHWMPITPGTQDVIIAAMIREGQLELAYDEMNKIPKVPVWLYVLLIHGLCDQKDFEAVLHLTYSLQDKAIDVPRPTWLHILQQASRHGHYDLTYRVWLSHVEPMYIIPNVECCIKVLELANQKAKLKLAESAMAVLEDRYPEDAAKQKALVETTYQKAGQVPDLARYRRGSMFALLSKAKGHHQAFFDPEIALAKRPLQRFLNPKRLERKRLEKLKSKRH